MEKNFKSFCDLDLDRTMPNVELVRAVFICYNIFKFQVPRSIIFRVIMLTDTHTHTDTQTHADEYSIVPVDKPHLASYYHINLC